MSSLKNYKSLKNAKQFNYFYNNSKKAYTSSAIVFYKKTDQTQIGFTASKKVGNAVKRNYAKRRMRALFLEFSDILIEGTFIIVAKKDILESEFDKLRKDIRYAFKKVGALKDAKKISS